jgi:hypothetical protein
MRLARVRCAAGVMILLSVVSPEAARAQGRGRFQMQSRIEPIDLVGFAAVQKELGLKPETVEKINALFDDYREESRSARRSARIDLDAPPGEQRKQSAKRQAAMQKVTDQFNTKVTTLLDQPQQARLREVGIQAVGPGALKDPSVIKELALTQEQQATLSRLHAELEQKMTDLVRSGGGGPLAPDQRRKRLEKLDQLVQEDSAKTTAVLTKAQQDQFARMKGKPFNLSLMRSPGPRPN